MDEKVLRLLNLLAKQGELDARMASQENQVLGCRFAEDISRLSNQPKPPLYETRNARERLAIQRRTLEQLVLAAEGNRREVKQLLLELLPGTPSGQVQKTVPSQGPSADIGEFLGL